MTVLIPETPPEYDSTRIVERPNGFYWQSIQGDEEHGPFATLLEAVQDMQEREPGEFEPGESVAEAEAEIGMADWIDPETGEPAEESVPRIQDV